MLPCRSVAFTFAVNVQASSGLAAGLCPVGIRNPAAASAVSAAGHGELGRCELGDAWAANGGDARHQGQYHKSLLSRNLSAS
jgi:hypothetical protein